MILAISLQLGVIYHEFIDGGVNSKIFSGFLAKLSEKPCDKEALFVYDNALCHNVDLNGLPDIHSVKKLPPWSPMFNPIEEVFALWKFEIKKKMANSKIRNERLDIGENRAIYVTMVELRRQILTREGLESLSVITQAKCLQFYNQSLLFLFKAIQDADL